MHLRNAVAATAATGLALLVASCEAGHAQAHSHHGHGRLLRVRQNDPAIEVNASIELQIGQKQDSGTKLAPGLDKATLAKIKQNLADHSSDSWVSGTRMEAILELDNPQISVYSPGYLSKIRSGSRSAEVDGIAKYWLDLLPAAAQQYVLEGAAGDTASVGVGFINAGLNKKNDQRKKYNEFTERELQWLLTVVPRVSNGAISHRPPNELAQPWDDNVYMVPPFLAYYGVVHTNITVAKEAFKQILAYRDILRDPETKLWKHILEGSWSDPTLWGTGMGWVAMGMVRVYATYANNILSHHFGSEKKALASWANELLEAVLPWVSAESNLLPNVYGPDRGFDDTASSAAVASAVYRMAQLGILKNEKKNLAKAEQIRKGVYAKLDPETKWLDSAADPLQWYIPTNESPESMAFVMLLEAAVNGYKARL